MLRIFKQYYPIRNIFFFIGEGLVIYVSVVVASFILLKAESYPFEIWLYLKIFLITFICQTCLYYNDLYDLKVTDSFSELGIRLLQALGVSAIFLAGIYIIFPGAIIGHNIFTLSIGFVLVFIVSWRICYKLILTHGVFNQKIILLGSGDLATNIINEITQRKDSGYTVSVTVRENSENNDFVDKGNIKATLYKKDYEGLCDMAEELNIKKIVVALTEKRGALPTKELVTCRTNGIEITEGSSFYEMLTGKIVVKQINPSWLIFSEGFQKSRVRRFLKRFMDLILSVVLLVLLSPVIIVTALLIKIDSTGPVIFSQERIGKNKKTYRIYKFRSMVADPEAGKGILCEKIGKYYSILWSTFFGKTRNNGMGSG